MTSPSIKDLQDQGRTVMLTRRPDLQGDEGDVSLMLRDEGVAMADIAIGVASAENAALFLYSARGDKLTKLAKDRYQIDRDLATAAQGVLTFTRGAGGAGTIDAGTRVATTADVDGSFVEYTTDVDLVFAAETSLSVAATASESGRDGNAQPTKINRILDTLFDNFSVSNAAAFVGGAPEQDDDSLVQECLDSRRALRRGIKEAVEFGAKQVSSVQVATAAFNGNIPTVYVSDIDGGSNAQMVADVAAELENWVAFGISVAVVGATLNSQSISVTLTVLPGFDVNTIVSQVRQSIESAINRLEVGQVLYLGLIETAIRNVDRDNILDVTFSAPSADVTPAPNELIRTTLALITVA